MILTMWMSSYLFFYSTYKAKAFWIVFWDVPAMQLRNSSCSLSVLFLHCNSCLDEQSHSKGLPFIDLEKRSRHVLPSLICIERDENHFGLITRPVFLGTVRCLRKIGICVTEKDWSNQRIAFFFLILRNILIHNIGLANT